MCKILQSEAYGKHIYLVCKICNARYHTKNIDYIGARSLFSVKQDCQHSINDLEVDKNQSREGY